MISLRPQVSLLMSLATARPPRAGVCSDPSTTTVPGAPSPEKETEAWKGYTSCPGHTPGGVEAGTQVYLL